MAFFRFSSKNSEPPRPEYETGFEQARSSYEALPPHHRDRIHKAPVEISGTQTPGFLSVSTGKPGLSYKFVKQYGITETGYISDFLHTNGPNGLFIDSSNNVYLAEERGNRFIKFDASGTPQLAIGKAGFNDTDEYVFNRPRDVTLDNSGNIWIVDDHRVTQYDNSGSILQVFPDWDDEPWRCDSDNGHFCIPSGIDFDSAGRLYVSDFGNHRIQIFDMTGGSPVYSTTLGVTGVPGSDNLHFNCPYHIIIDSLDIMYVADEANHRVQRCEYSTGWICSTFHGTGIEGSGADQLRWPDGIAVDTSNNVYIVDSNNGRVKKCDPSGTCTNFATGFWWPQDVAVDSSLNVYISDYSQSAVFKFNPSGTTSTAFVGIPGIPYTTTHPMLNSPWGIAVNADGSLYITEDYGQRLIKLNPDGSQLWTVGEPGIWGPWNDPNHFGVIRGSPAVDSDGRIYVPDTYNHIIKIYNPDSTFYNYLGIGWGSGQYQFKEAFGVTISPVNGDIYVVERDNNRVQIFDKFRVFKGYLDNSITGADFDGPRGVWVDNSGYVYVSDRDNYRVQVFNSSLVLQYTIGVKNDCGWEYDYLCAPTGITVDKDGRIYIVEQWNNRVQVFDSSGAYLATIGGDWGSKPPQMRAPRGVAVDDRGNVYVTDHYNHRVLKFSPGIVGWEQVNVNGFGSVYNQWANALEVFNNTLYAGTHNGQHGGEIWKLNSSWAPVKTGGFSDSNNTAIQMLKTSGGYLYAGTGNYSQGGEVWRSSDGATWNQVIDNGFDSPSTNSQINFFYEYNNALYASAGTWNESGYEGAQVWRTTNGLNWTNVITGGLGDIDNQMILAIGELDNNIYVGTANLDTGGEIWRSGTGNAGTWSQVNIDGFGDANNDIITALEYFNGNIYTGVRNWNTGSELWRSSNGTIWNKVLGGGLGKGSHFGWIDSLIVFEEKLFAVTRSYDTGLVVWSSEDGEIWYKENPAGFGNFLNFKNGDGKTGVVIYDGQLHVGTYNEFIGGGVWKMLDLIFLPLVMR